jgi:hypothetical protein
MYGQMNATQGTRKYRPNYLADVNARLAYLPQQMEQQSEERFREAQIKNMGEQNTIDQARLGIEQSNLELGKKRQGLEEQQLGLASQSAAFNQKATQKGMDLKERQEAMSTGVGAAGLGFNVLGAKWGDMKLGDVPSKLGFGGGDGETKSPSGFWNDMPVGASLAGGLGGFGASRMVPTKNKFLKAGVGAGVGGLIGFLGAGSGNGLAGALGGGLLGGIGGMF